MRVGRDEEVGEDAGAGSAAEFVFAQELASEECCLDIERSDLDSEGIEEFRKLCGLRELSGDFGVGDDRDDDVAGRSAIRRARSEMAESDVWSKPTSSRMLVSTDVTTSA